MAGTLTHPDIRPQVAEHNFSIEAFLERDREKDLLRFSTAGSVDDGKSTLIGRLLYDTQSVYDDQLLAIRNKGTAGGKGTADPQLDFALLTDGLRAEREQGITIDVAYRYFSTPRRKFIIADTPGHEQYTRNMATGASTADAAIVLVDARKGVLPQSRRHAYIATLLGVQHVIVAVNKMDLVAYHSAIFASIRAEFEGFARYAAAESGHAAELHFIPVSALLGVNVVHASDETPWYGGPSLLELLESLPAATHREAAAFRLPVQRVIRPHQGFRGFAGQIASGAIHVGDGVTVLPSGRTSHVERIVTYDGDLPVAHAPLSITLTLEDELDISRGDLLTRVGEEAPVVRRFAASLVWMDAQPFDAARRYLLKHASQTVPAEVRLRHRVDLEKLANEPALLLEMNGIGVAEIETRRPIAVERYRDNRTLGAFVLIDAETNATAGAGMVREVFSDQVGAANTAPVTPLERAGRWGHAGVVLRLNAPAAVAHALERALLEGGAFVVRPPDDDPTTPEMLASAGALVLVTEESSDLVSLRIGSSRAEFVPRTGIPEAVASLLNLLQQTKIVHRERVR
jgi:sulfate adenylyltransferase subunit 1